MFLTANEMADKIEFLLNLKDDEFSYEDSELSSILNTEQEHFKLQFFRGATNALKQGFEETEIRSWGFGNLITPATLTASAIQTDVFENGKYWDLPDDFSLLLTEIPTSDQLKCNSETQYIKPKVRVASHDEYTKLIESSYHKPFINNQEGLVWRMYESGNRVQLVTDGTFNITGYFIKYLKQIPAIVVDRDSPANQVNCVLSADMHDTLVEMAIKRIKSSNNEQYIPNQPGIEQIT